MTFTVPTFEPEVIQAAARQTCDKALAYNAGVQAVLDIATRSATAITSTSTRPIAESFAATALSELAEAGRALLLPVDPEQPSPTRADQPPGPHSPVPQAAEIAL